MENIQKLLIFCNSSVLCSAWYDGKIWGPTEIIIFQCHVWLPEMKYIKDYIYKQLQKNYDDLIKWYFCFNYIYSRFWSKMLIRYEEYYCVICCHITFPLLGVVKNMFIYLLYGLLVVHNFHWHKPHFAWSISSCRKNFNHYS